MRTAIPAELKWLMSHGILFPDDARSLGCKVMTCVNCQSEVALAATFPRMAEADIARAKKLPSMIWGKDILVLCPRCSMKQEAK